MKDLILIVMKELDFPRASFFQQAVSCLESIGPRSIRVFSDQKEDQKADDDSYLPILWNIDNGE